MDAESVRRIVRQIELSREELELEILRTKTGLSRETLTEANIHLMVAVKLLLDVG